MVTQKDPHTVDIGAPSDPITSIDIVLGILTLPLLLWVIMGVTTSSAHALASRRTRLRIYSVLLAIEVIAVAALIWRLT